MKNILQMLYSELKTYFETTSLPATLNAKHCYYTDVKRTVVDWLWLVDNSESDKIVSDTEYKLRVLYDALQVKENWDAPKPEWNGFNNKNGI